MGPGTSPEVSSRVGYHRRRIQKALLASGGLLMTCALSKVVVQTLLRVSMLFQVVAAFRDMLVLLSLLMRVQFIPHCLLVIPLTG